MTRDEMCEIHCACGRSADFRLRLSSEGIDGVAKQKAAFRREHPAGELATHLAWPVEHRILTWPEVLALRGKR